MDSSTREVSLSETIEVVVATVDEDTHDPQHSADQVLLDSPSPESPKSDEHSTKSSMIDNGSSVKSGTASKLSLSKKINTPESLPSWVSFIEREMTLPKLVLYAYFWWFLWLFSTQGIQVMGFMDYLNSLFVSVFVGLALNMAAYQPPLFGKQGYLRHKFKIGRFFIIPFCVASLSVTCAKSDHCAFFFPSQIGESMAIIIPMIAIIAGGFSARFILVQKLQMRNE